MDSFDRVALPVLVVASFGLALALPALRLRRRTGRWPCALRRRRAPAEVVLATVTAGFCAWCLLYGWMGPERLGVWRAPAALRTVGWVLIVLALALVMIAQARMGASWRIGIDEGTTALVVDGVFRFSRNPIYTGILVGLLGVVLVSPAVWTVAGWVAMAAALGGQVRAEERYLSALHGERYLVYAARVGRFVPGLGRLRR